MLEEVLWRLNNMRHICLDTETTGFSPSKGDRIVEIACVELIDFTPTGKYFHSYINPQREVPEEVTKIHGLTNEFLSDKAIFSEIADEFCDFIDNSPLVIHNAPFDMRFIHHEINLCGLPPVKNDIIDTLVIARKSYPGCSNSLDGLCTRYNINTDDRERHGALIDTQLLAKVFIELISVCNIAPPTVKISLPSRNIIDMPPPF